MILTHMRKSDENSKAFLGRIWLGSHFIEKGVRFPVLRAEPSLMNRDSIFEPYWGSLISTEGRMPNARIGTNFPSGLKLQSP